MKKPLVFLFFFLLNSALFSQTLWNKCEYGMTDKELLKIFPNLTEKDDESILRIYSKDDGYKILTIDSFNISNINMHVFFLIKNTRLESVHIVSYWQEMLDLDGFEYIFNTLELLLTDKYGKPYYSSKPETYNWAVSWSSNQILIDLRMDPGMGLEIRYKVSDL